MKKMKKQFISLFMLLCMIISMFPTTALAANIIDVSGNVTITRSDEELTCADNLYYGEVNVNGSATESKTRLTHTVLPLIQWQDGNNIYQIIPSAYKYYVSNINDPNDILEGIEGSEGSSTLSGWPGTYKCYQTVVTTDGETNGTATFDIDLIYQFSRLNASIGWNYTSNWGGRTLHFTITQTVNESTTYTVTYTDGVDGEEIFADQVYGNLLSGVATPAFEGTPTRTGYVFKGWNPEVAATVTGNATYVATWGEDKNNNGIDDNEETKYTVTYTDGVDGKEIFADQVYGNLLSGVATPAFEGTPTRTGYVFKGWNPEVAATVTGNATYVAVWEKAKDNNGDTKPGDTKPRDTKPGDTKSRDTKPGNTKPNTTTNGSSKAGKSAKSPKTSDTANLALWMALLVVSGGSMVINKKKKYNR